MGFHFVRIVLGAILLAAAGLKAVALWNGQSAGPLLSSPRWQIGTIEIESLVGLWLLSGLYARVAWLAAVPLFMALSGFTLYLALDGQHLLFASLVLSPASTAKAAPSTTNCTDNGCSSRCSPTLGCNRPGCLCNGDCNCLPDNGANYCMCK